MHARIPPATPPFSPAVQAALDQLMPPGVPPLVLFTCMARDERLFNKLFSSGLLDRGHLSLRQRELVIHRVTALCGSEYEWGVHAAFFADRVEFDEDQLYSLVHGQGSDSCWEKEERLLLEMCDALHDTCTLTAGQWAQLRGAYSEEQMLELLMLCGYYRSISYLTNALHLPPEDFARTFPPRETARNSAK